MKKRIFSIVMYLVNIIIVLLPWLTVGSEKLNLIQFAMKFRDIGMDGIAKLSGFPQEQVGELQVGVMIELGGLAIFIIMAVLHLLLTLFGKKSRVNFVCVGITTFFLYSYASGVGLSAFTAEFEDMIVPILLEVISGLEIVIGFLIEGWRVAVAETNRQKMEEQEFKKEAEERLRFDGKYTKMFYQYIWKNFKYNWKDYLLLLVANVFIFTSLVIGFGMNAILSVDNTTKGTQLFNGLSRILVNAMIPLIAIATVMFVMLFFQYLKSRARNFGVFLTLGMRRKLLYQMIGIEYLTMLLIAVLAGATLGTVAMWFFVNHSLQYAEVQISMASVGVTTYMKALGVMLGICIVSLMAARDIYRDFNVGKSTDLRNVKEKLPVRFRRVILVVGAVLCIISMYRYQNLDNYESVKLLLLFLVGMYFVFRYGMAEYLFRERKSHKYLNKMLLHNQLYHRSRTSTGYMWAMFVIHFCVMFYFTFQLAAANISENAESLFPYDAVCLAGEDDNDILDELREYETLEMIEYPALRVSSYDSTEELEDTRSGIKAIQGQHIGISESTYHELKKRIDPTYEASDLGLDADGEYIYIIYQQDKSEHAQPICYYAPRSKPILHIGQPCRGVSMIQLGQGDVAYKAYQVKGEEIGSLIGTFRQGMKEDIVVFSDEYFAKAQEFWKTTDVYSGEQIEEKEERIEGLTISQGITRLILMNAEEEQLPVIEQVLERLEERHQEAERSLFDRYLVDRGVYDASVSSYYMKDEAVTNLITERVMKATMNTVVIGVFFVMNLLFVMMKLLSEKERNCKNKEFLTCMGMRKKERIHFVKAEILRYCCLLPMGVAAVFSGIFTICTVHARMYTWEDVQKVLGYMLPIWLGYVALSGVVLWMIVSVYTYRMEREKDDRSS